MCVSVGCVEKAPTMFESSIEAVISTESKRLPRSRLYHARSSSLSTLAEASSD